MERPGVGATGNSAEGSTDVTREKLDVDAIMERVRAEMKSRGALLDGITLPRRRPARLEDKSRYILGDFLAFDDQDFIDVAYQTLLGHPAVDGEAQGYLDALRSGCMSKVEILGVLRLSEEGRKQGVRVDGLLSRYRLHRWRHVRVLGWFLRLAMMIRQLPRLALRLQAIEARAACDVQEMWQLLDRVETALERHFADVGGAINSLREELYHTAALSAEDRRSFDVQVETLESWKRVIDARMETVQEADTARTTQYEQVSIRLAGHGAAIFKLKEQAEDDQRQLYALIDRLIGVLDKASPPLIEGTATAEKKSVGEELSTAAFGRTLPQDANGNLAPEVGEESSLEAQYASFEDTFRGARDDIKARVAHYLNSLATAGILPGDPDLVLDLGSGRGEWLEVLAEHGYHARGVDINRSMLKESIERGLDVIECSAIDYLRTQQPDSFAAVTAMHLVEHIRHPELNQLLNEALRVLRPGGILILETPNPENVRVGSCNFYMDPTHLHPIPPLLLQWVVQARGFEEAIVCRLTEHRGTPDLVPVGDDVPGARQINQMVAAFTAASDYAVIARKPMAGTWANG